MMTLCLSCILTGHISKCTPHRKAQSPFPLHCATHTLRTIVAPSQLLHAELRVVLICSVQGRHLSGTVRRSVGLHATQILPQLL